MRKGRTLPEGPTIKNMADRLRAALTGQVITGASSRYKKSREEDWPTLLVGRTIMGVRSHGKNLFIDLSEGYIIYSHMLMWGSWHIYEPGEEWRKAEKLARLVLETPGKVAVLFNAPLCDVIPPEHLQDHKTSALGPDLLAPDFDRAEVWRRIQLPENREKELGEISLDQTVLTGIGNILKSEILFQAGLHPLKPAASLDENEFEDFINYSLELLQSSYEKGMRKSFIPDWMRPEITSFGFVYRRRNSPCHLCQTPIEMIRQGEMQRSTYFCPTCQPLAGPVIPFQERLKPLQQTLRPTG
jgi:endonuclease-8